MIGKVLKEVLAIAHMEVIENYEPIWVCTAS